MKLINLFRRHFSVKGEQDFANILLFYFGKRKNASSSKIECNEFYSDQSGNYTTCIIWPLTSKKKKKRHKDVYCDQLPNDNT